ncbi:MAG: zinc ribbon domain-containing protein [Deltaproteobacteria bacterium]|nr:zinc ribbon domain-containing protein [Deltaproteobacteria bacterium]
MPIYEYSCNKCKKSFEIFQKITEKPRKVCEKCGFSNQERN